MKTKLFAVAILTLMLLSIVPAFSFEPDPEKCVLWIAPQNLKIEGPCTESQSFAGSVNVYQIVDLWAWDICIKWDESYINMTSHTLNIPAEFGTFYEVLEDKIYKDGAGALAGKFIFYLRVIVTAKAGAANFTGGMSLIDFEMHVEYEPCWEPDGAGCVTADIVFRGAQKLSTGCGDPIDCEIHEGKVSLNPAKPNIEVFFTDVWPGPPLSAAWNASKVAQGWFEDQVISAYVWISNATKLYDIEFILIWNTSLLHVDLQQITINEEAFPMPWSHLDQEVYELGEEPYWDAFCFYIERDHDKPPIKGTFWIVKLDFKVSCVRNSTDDFPIPWDTCIGIFWASLSTSCELPYDSCHPEYLDVSHAKYFWTPIAYDFDQNGHVGVEDILWIMDYYGDTDTSYDLNKDGIVDIYDIVLVSKAYCNSTPPEMPEDP